MLKDRKTRKVSKKVVANLNNNVTVWGKNPKLVNFWRKLASGEKLVLIYKDKTHTYVNMPKPTTQKYKTMIAEFYENDDIVAMLSSNMSQDAYEVYLYPKAKDNSVEYVIKNYKKYFKPLVPGDKLRSPL